MTCRDGRLALATFCTASSPRATARIACGPYRSMHCRTVLKARIACSLKAPEHTSRTLSYCLSRSFTTKKSHEHCPWPHHSAVPCALSRQYSTHSLASDASTGSRQNSVDSRSNLERSQLALSDAQRRTIYALSTPPGKAGVAVIRVSGPDALEVWRGMVRTRAGGKGKAREREPEPWRMHRCSVVHPGSGEVLDDGLAVYFKGE